VFVFVLRQSNDIRVPDTIRLRRARGRDRRVRPIHRQDHRTEAAGAREELRDASRPADSLQGPTERELRVHYTAGAHVQHALLLPVGVQHDIRGQPVRHGQRSADSLQLFGRAVHILHVRQHGRGRAHGPAEIFVLGGVVRAACPIPTGADDGHVQDADAVTVDGRQGVHSEPATIPVRT